MSRSCFSPEQRQLRSRLAKLVHGERLLRGTLALRKVTCGNRNCRCARGERHEALYLTCSRAGRVEQFFVAKRLRPTVRRWVGNYRSVRDLLERLSESAWRELRSRKE